MKALCAVGKSPGPGHVVPALEKRRDALAALSVAQKIMGGLSSDNATGFDNCMLEDAWEVKNMTQAFSEIEWMQAATERRISEATPDKTTPEAPEPDVDFMIEELEPVFEGLMQTAYRKQERKKLSRLASAMHLAETIGQGSPTMIIGEQTVFYNSSGKLAEVFAPDRFAHRAASHGVAHAGSWDVVLDRPLTTERDRALCDAELDKKDPTLTVYTPPCTYLSALQNINQGKHKDPQQHLRNVHQACSYFRWCVASAKRRAARVRYYLLESGTTSKGWRLADVERELAKMESYVVRMHQCQTGLKDSESGLPIMKPTTFATNEAHLAQALYLRCSGEHIHQWCFGSNKHGARAHQARVWTPYLVDTILKGHKRDLLEENKGTKENYFLGQVLEENETAHALDDVLMADEDFPEAEKPAPPKQTKKQKRTKEPEPEVPEPVLRRAIERLHKALSHCSRADLVRVLLHGGASSAAIKIARDFKCPVSGTPEVVLTMILQ